MMKKILGLLLAVTMVLSLFTACGGTAAESETSQNTAETQAGDTNETVAESESDSASLEDAPELPGLTCVEKLDLEYATCFNVYTYDDGCKLIQIEDDQQFLLIPEGGSAPEGLSEDIVQLQMPLTDLYDAATSSVALFAAMDSLDVVKMVSVQKSGWTFDSIKKALDSGDTIFAGKYSEPDYETLINNGCQLAIESTMIYHTPEVQEMIETLGIPVLVEHSSYESNPLGRMEWVKLYGVLLGREDAADAFYQKEKQVIDGIEDYEDTGLKVAYFYISSDGKVVVRSSSDYISTMIDMAGGDYVFTDLVDDTGKTSIDMGIETFFEAAKDADIVIYNGSIDTSVKSLKDLKAKSSVIKDIKAVKNGNTWITGSSVYQRTDVIGEMILDFHRVITAADLDKLEYLQKLE